MASTDAWTFALLLLASWGSSACGELAPRESEPFDSSHASTQDALVTGKQRCGRVHTPETGRVTDLGYFESAPYDFRYSFAQAINDRKTVVGHALARVSPELNQQHAFRWKPETGMVDLGTLEGSSYSIATDVNDFDQVVGNAKLPGGTQHAVLWDPHGRIRDLGTLGGASSYAAKINNRGQVLGTSANSDNELRVFIWEARTGMIEQPLPGVTDVHLNGFNDSGEFVGGWLKAGSISMTPFKWTKEDGGTELERLGATRGEATGLNARGEIVGFIYTDRNVAVRWTPSGVVDLAHLPDREAQYPISRIESFPRAINDRGAIAGSDTTDSDLTAIRWLAPDEVERVPLGAIQSDAFDINNRGDIVGGYYAAGMADWHGFLWEPRKH